MKSSIIEIVGAKRTPEGFTERIRRHYKVCDSEYCLCRMILHDYELCYNLSITPDKSTKLQDC